MTDRARFAEPLLVAGPKLALDKIAAAKIAAGEVVRLPYVHVGEWNFRDSYGPVEVTTEDLDIIVRNFKSDARRQDLPLLVNEEHSELPPNADPSTYIGPGAVGWIKDLVLGRDIGLDPLTIYADAELNRVGEQVYNNDRYRAVSPELLLNWIDPETDQAWGKTAAGLAFTTMPKMKGLAQRTPYAIAASERARVLAYAERGSPGHGFRGNQHMGGAGRHVMSMSAEQTRTHLTEAHGMTPKEGASKGALQNAHLICHTHAGMAEFRGADMNSVHIDGPMTNLSAAAKPNRISEAGPSKVSGNKANDGPPDITGDVYAFPQQKRLPLQSAAAVRGALARFMTVDASEHEREIAWTRVITAGDRYGVTVPKSWRSLKASECVRLLMQEEGYENDLHGPAYQQVVAGLQALIAQEAGEGEPDDISPLVAIWQSVQDWMGDESDEYGDSGRYTDDDPYGLPVAVDVQPLDDVDAQPEVLPDQPITGGGQAPALQVGVDTSPSDLAGGAAASWANPALPDIRGRELSYSEGGVQVNETKTETTPAAEAPAAAVAAPVVETKAPEVETSKADMAEQANMLKAAEARIAAAETKAAELGAEVETLKANERARIAADKQVKVIDRLKNLVKTGRITPAAEAKFAEQVAKFAESDELAESFLGGLEALPEGHAVPLKELGTSEKGPEAQTEGERVAIAVHTLMSERKQSVEPKDPTYLNNYKNTLLEVTSKQR